MATEENYIKLSSYNGGFIYQHFWSIEIIFNPNLQGGKIEVSIKSENNRTVEFKEDSANQIKKILEESKITSLPSSSPHDDLGYGEGSLHVSFQGKKFSHASPTGCVRNVVTPPTPQQKEIYSSFVSSILSVVKILGVDVSGA